MLIANWVIGTLLLTCAVIKLNWGAELLVYAHLNNPLDWRILRVGELYFGWFHLTAGLAMYGWIGWILLERATETATPWPFAAAAAAFTFDAIMSWFLLGESRTQEDA